MKKILSFMLVLAMLAMMCINVSAETETTKLIGNRTENGTNINDGVAANDPFSTASNSSDITATISTENSVRYAVDLEYTPFAIRIESNADWNVDTLQYEGTTKVYVDDVLKATFTSTNPENEESKTIDDVAEFTVTNYSNAPVAVSATVNPTTNYVNKISGVVAGDELAAVTPVVGASGTAVSKVFSASLTCSDWTATFATATGEIVIATVTFSIAKTAVTTAPSTVPNNEAPNE